MGKGKELLKFFMYKGIPFEMESVSVYPSQLGINNKSDVDATLSMIDDHLEYTELVNSLLDYRNTLDN